MRYLAVAVLGAVALTAVSGCGTRKPVLYGLVTLDGKPLDNGTMQFFPVAGDGQTAGVTIGTDGRYRAEVSPTKMKVVIHSSKVIGKRKLYDDQPNSPTVDILEEVLPARYSDMNKTELIVTVPAGESEKNFELTSGRAPPAGSKAGAS